MGTLRLVHPLKSSRLANPRGMTDTFKLSWWALALSILPALPDLTPPAIR